jgi:putative oxidoreductase
MKESAMVTLIDLRRLLHALSARLAFAPPLLARLVIGVVFVHSGYGKWSHLDQVVKFFADLGIPFPELQAPFVATVELVCGALVLVGLGTRLVSVPLMGTMVVALATALSARITGLNALFGLAEFVYIVLLVSLAVGGAGPVSVDRFVARAIDRADAEDRAEDAPLHAARA